MGVHASEGQRSIWAVHLNHFDTVVFKTRSLTEPGAPQLARLSSELRHLSVFTSPVVGHMLPTSPVVGRMLPCPAFHVGAGNVNSGSQACIQYYRLACIILYAIIAYVVSTLWHFHG